MYLHVPIRIMIGFFQGTCKKRSSINFKVISMTFDYAHRPLRRRIIKRRHEPSMKDILSLMKLLGKER